MNARSARLWALGALAVGAMWVALTVVASPRRNREWMQGEPPAEASVAMSSAGVSSARVAVPAGPADPGDPVDPVESDGSGVRQPGEDAESEDGERAHYAAFVALAAGDETIDAAAVLRADGPTYRKVALLRALLDTGSPDFAAACALALAELPLEADERGVSVPEFAVRLLSAHAEGRPELQAVLHDTVWGRSRVSDTGLRTRAAKGLVAAADPPALERIARELRSDPDSALLRVVSAALTDGTIAPSMAHLFADLALPPPSSAEERE
jgi:hypothetical protein